MRLWGALAAVLMMTTPAVAEPMTYRQLLERPRAKADARIAYGPEPSQFVELWRPAGPGPHPVVVLVHGGCWQAKYPGLELLDYAAEDLRRRGLAVWNIEHRRIDEPGGGYPGTFLDVGAAFDLLRTEGPKRGLSLDRVVAAGHSAGAHLTLWAALRAGLPNDSPLRTIDPLPVGGVVSIGGLGDLEAVATDPDAIAACGEGTVAQLIGAADRSGDPYADTSPARLPARGVRQVLVHGELDHIAPERLGGSYVVKVLSRPREREKDRAGVEMASVPGAGHFELIASGTHAWRIVAEEIASLQADSDPSP